MVLEASVLARLFGMRLLTLQASVVATPAAMVAPDHPVEAAPTAPRRLPEPAAGAAPAVDGGAIGSRLGEAMRCLDEGHALLAAARGTSSRPTRP